MMSANKYPSTFSRQMEAMCLLSFKSFSATRAVLKIRKCSRIQDKWPLDTRPCPMKRKFTCLGGWLPRKQTEHIIRTTRAQKQFGSLKNIPKYNEFSTEFRKH